MEKELVIRDIDLPKKFELLYERKVYVYGAGFWGEKTCRKLKEIGVAVAGLVDRREVLHGTLLWGSKVYSPDELAQISQEDEGIIIIISTNQYADEIVSTIIEKRIECGNVFTVLGLDYAIYFNLNRLENKILKRYQQRYLVWKYNNEIEMLKKQAVLQVTPFMEGDADIIVHQPGKVGSNTISTTLRHHVIPAVRTHGILYSCEYANGGDELKNTMVDAIYSEDRKVKLITLVRDPIAKDIGHFFQKLTATENDTAWFVKGLMEKDFQQSYLNYLSVVSPFDFSNGKRKDEFNKKMVSHIDYIGSKNSNGALWGWYEEEYKNILGIDVLAHEFDVDKGYTVIRHKNVEVLIMQLEKLNTLENVLAEFVDVPELKLVSVNRGVEKAYRYIYKAFQKEVRIPKEYMEFCYNNPYMRHFYSKEDIERFYKKWEDKIIK